MTDKPEPKDAQKDTKEPGPIIHLGMMGDSTVEQNLGERGDRAKGIKEDEVGCGFQPASAKKEGCRESVWIEESRISRARRDGKTSSSSAHMRKDAHALARQLIPRPRLKQAMTKRCLRKLGPLWVRRGGAVTGTRNGGAKAGSFSRDSGCGRSPPHLERFVSEDSERGAGCEMALDIESVVDDGVSGEETLG